MLYHKVVFTRLYRPIKNKSFFLFGPRGTGKTTWLKAVFPQSFYIDLLNSETYRLLLSSPHRLEVTVETILNKALQSPHLPDSNNNPIIPIIIDEVQKIPALLDEVHRLIESRKWTFILTGSSARKLKRGGANLLAGRAYRKNFFPLTCWELGKAFDLKKALNFGLLPSIWDNIDHPEQYLSTYVFHYLKEEVIAEGVTRNLETFGRFLELMSFSQAQPLTLTTLASDVGISSKMAASYVEILEDLLLAKKIPAFTRKAKRRIARHPKFFFFDIGVYRALRPKGPFDTSEEIDGAALETLFYQHHEALGAFCDWDQTLYYWRTALQVEVDFVSYGQKGLFAFEIKRSESFKKEELKGLKQFLQDYPIAQCYFLYAGKAEIYLDGIKIMPFEKALWELPKILGIADFSDLKVNL
jgi:predicted AAA+ superfamily ATPase